MVSTRRTEYITDVGTKKSGTCVIVHRDPNKCGLADKSGNSTYSSASLKKGETTVVVRRDHLANCNDKEGNVGLGGNDEAGVGGGMEMGNGGVDSGDGSRNDKSRFSVLGDEKLIDILGGNVTGDGKEMNRQDEDENREEYNDKVEGSDDDVEKTIVHLTSMINEDGGSPSWITQLINEAREVSTYQKTRAGDIITCPECRLDVTNNIRGLLCDKCKTWYHKTCIKLNNVYDQRLVNTTEQWICCKCRVNCGQSINHEEEKPRTISIIFIEMSKITRIGLEKRRYVLFVRRLF